MKDPHSVIAQATNGITEELAEDYGLSLSRMYQLLGPNNPYPKAKLLIRRITTRNLKGGALIRADLDAMFTEILNPHDVSIADLNKEAHEAIQAMLVGRPIAEQKQELRELIASAQMKLETLDKVRSIA